jgi:hypothetical protein
MTTAADDRAGPPSLTSAAPSDPGKEKTMTSQMMPRAGAGCGALFAVALIAASNGSTAANYMPDWPVVLLKLGCQV